jgi:hypothetical protein
MPFSRLPSRLRLIAWCIVISAAIGAVYALLTTLAEGGQPLAPWAVPRGLLTGAVISGLLASLEIFLLDATGDGALAAPLRRLPFSALVTIKTLVYLAVILFSLTLGGWALPAPGQSGLRPQDILFSLAVSFAFVFVFSIHRLMGRTCCSTSSPAATTGRGWKSEFCYSWTWTLDDDPRLSNRGEDFPVERFVAKSGVEALDEAVFPRAAPFNGGCLGADGSDPVLHGLGDELRTVAGSDGLGNPAQNEETRQKNIDDGGGVEFPIDPDG